MGAEINHSIRTDPHGVEAQTKFLVRANLSCVYGACIVKLGFIRFLNLWLAWRTFFWSFCNVSVIQSCVCWLIGRHMNVVFSHMGDTSWCLIDILFH